MSSDLVRERNLALRRAYHWARLGQSLMATAYYRHANNFWPVSARTVRALNKILRGHKSTTCMKGN